MAKQPNKIPTVGAAAIRPVRASLSRYTLVQTCEASKLGLLIMYT
jgi:hypothetical protein